MLGTSVVCCYSIVCFEFFFFKQKTAYEMRISDWSSDVCSSDLLEITPGGRDEAHHGCNQEHNYLTVLEPSNCGLGVAMTLVPILAQNNEPTSRHRNHRKCGHWPMERTQRCQNTAQARTQPGGNQHHR